MGAGGATVLDSGRGGQYTGKVTAVVIMSAIAAGCGGLLFGYDNGVVGGVIAMRGFASRFFPDTLSGDANVQDAYCKYNNHLLALFTSSLYLAAAFAALVGSWTCNRFGRRNTMLAGALFFLIGVALQTSAFQIGQLVVGRVILGVGVGLTCQATPLYLSEMAPFRLRGAFNFMFQLCVTIGIFVAQLINYGMDKVDSEWNWRVSLGLAGVPALIFGTGMLCLPDTANSLIERGHLERGERALQRARGVQDVYVELEDITNAVNIARAIRNPYTTILRRRYRPQLIITLLIPIIQQFTGINAVIFYSPQLLQSVSGADAALLNTVIIGAVNVGSTVIGLLIVDRVGRKFLFVQGGTQALICEFIIGILIAKYMGPTGGMPQSVAKATLALICIYIAGFAWSWGPLGWLVPSEIQPLETRAAGVSINTFMNMLMTFLIGQTFLSMLCTMRFGVFFFFGGCLLLGVLFAAFFIPETRNVPIEEMEEIRFGQHWFWGKLVAGTRPPAEREELDMVQVVKSDNGPVLQSFRRTSASAPNSGANVLPTTNPVAGNVQPTTYRS